MKPSMQNRSWQGYLRKDGRKGIRNHLLVVYTVECASFVAQEIGKGEPDVHVIGFPGCYDNDYAIRLMLALSTHPNIGGVLCVGLGCEYTQPHRIAESVRQSGRPAESFFIQENGGTRSSIALGKEKIASLRARANADAVKTPMTWRDLTIGAECGGSDGTSGLAGNPVVGRAFDRLVEMGGTAIFEETVEMIGLRDIMISRAASPAAAAQLAAAYDKAFNYSRAVRQCSVAPGNFAGGLTTIEEKSMGAFAKGGSKPIDGVIRVSERPAASGPLDSRLGTRRSLHAIRLHQPQRHRRHHGSDRRGLADRPLHHRPRQRHRQRRRPAHQDHRKFTHLSQYVRGHGLQRRPRPLGRTDYG